MRRTTLFKASVLRFARDAAFLRGHTVLAAEVEVVIAVTLVIAGGILTLIAMVTAAAAAAAGAFTVVASHGDLVSRIIILMMAYVLTQ